MQLLAYFYTLTILYFIQNTIQKPIDHDTKFNLRGQMLPKILTNNTTTTSASFVFEKTDETSCDIPMYRPVNTEDYKRKSLTECVNFEITELLPGTEYEFIYSYGPLKIEVMHKFRTNIDHKIIIEITNIVNDRLTLNIDFDPKDSALEQNKCNTTITPHSNDIPRCRGKECLNSCSKINVINLAPGVIYIFKVEAPLSTSSKPAYESFITPETSLVISEVTSNSVTYTIAGNIPSCIVTIEKANIGMPKSTPYSDCSMFTVSALASSTIYKIEVTYANIFKPLTSSFETLMDHKITLTAKNIQCTNATIAISFTPSDSTLKENTCLTKIVGPKEHELMCGTAGCENSCNEVNLTGLTPNTLYSLSVSAPAAYTNSPESINFKTNKSQVITLKESDITMNKFTITISSADALPSSLTLKVKGFNNYSMTINDASNVTEITVPQAGTKYTVTLELDDYCDLPSIDVTTSNPTINISNVTTVSLVLTVTGAQEGCSLSYKILSTDNPIPVVSNSCAEFSISNLNPGTTYMFIYSYPGIENVVTYSFQTNPDHLIHAEATNITCDSATIEISIENIDSSSNTFDCETTFLEPVGQIVNCTGTNCRKSCSSIALRGLKTFTDYKLNISAPLSISQNSNSFGFKTYKDDVFILTSSQVTIRGFRVSVLPMLVKVATDCEYSILKTGGKPITKKNQNCNDVAFDDLTPDSEYNVTLNRPGYCAKPSILIRTSKIILQPMKVTTTTASFGVINSLETCTVSYKVTTDTVFTSIPLPNCNLISISGLLSNTEYTLSYKSAILDTPVEIKFTTKIDHIISLSTSTVICTKATLAISFAPVDSSLKDFSCETTIIKPLGEQLSCIGNNCALSCSSIQITNLKPNTEYTFQTTAPLEISATSRSFTFRTHPYTLSSADVLTASEITPDSFVISVSGSMIQNEFCNFSLTEGIGDPINHTNVLCNNYKFTKLKYNTRYTVTLLTTDDCVFLSNTVNTLIPSIENYQLNVNTASFRVKGLISACSLSYEDKNGASNVSIPINCSDFTLGFLLPETEYTIFYRYDEVVQSIDISFTTKKFHKLYFIMNDLTCNSVRINYFYSPSDGSLQQDTCFTSFKKPEKAVLQCKGINCEKSCNSIELINLKEATTYNIAVQVPLDIFAQDASFEFTTEKPETFMLTSNKKTQSSIVVDVDDVHTPSGNCDYSIGENGKPHVLLKNVTCHNYEFNKLKSGVNYNIHLIHPISCLQGQISVTTNPPIIKLVFTRINTAKFIITGAHDKCEIFYRVKVGTFEVKAETSNCSEVFITRLGPNTNYVIIYKYEGIATPVTKEFKTLIDHKINLEVNNILCNSALLTIDFSPAATLLDSIICKTEITSPKNVLVSCDGANCESSCTSINLKNLISNASYTIEFSAPDTWSSKAVSKAFNINPSNPYLLETVYTKITSINVSIKSSLSSSVPCNVLITRDGTKKIQQEIDNNCRNVVFNNLLPNTNYTLSVKDDLNEYCDESTLKVKTDAINATLTVISIGPHFVTFSIITEEKFDIPDSLCTINATNLLNNSDISTNSNNCSNITIHKLRSATNYQFAGSSNFLAFMNNITLRTDTYYPAAKYHARLEKNKLIVNVIDINDTDMFVIPYLMKVLSTIDSSKNISNIATLSDFFENKIILDASNTTAFFDNLTLGVTYKLKMCSVPKNTNCSFTYSYCLTCSEQYFYTPKLNSIPAANLDYTPKTDSITLTYTTPDVAMLGDITSMVVYIAKGNRPLRTPVRFYSKNISEVIDGNEWKTARTVPIEDINNNGKIDINLFRESNLYNDADRGHYYYAVIGFCTNITCITSKIYEKIYISSYNEKIELIIFAVFAVAFLFLWILFVVLSRYYIINSNISQYIGSNKGISVIRSIYTSSNIEKRLNENPESYVELLQKLSVTNDVSRYEDMNNSNVKTIAYIHIDERKPDAFTEDFCLVHLKQGDIITDSSA